MAFWEPTFWDIAGLVLGAGGFGFTGWQAWKARTAAQAARDATERAAVAFAMRRTSTELLEIRSTIERAADELSRRELSTALVLVRQARNQLIGAAARSGDDLRAAGIEFSGHLRSLAGIERRLRDGNLPTTTMADALVALRDLLTSAAEALIVVSSSRDYADDA